MKKLVPATRSRRSMPRAAVRTGKERRARMAVMKMPQMVRGSRPMDMPRVRRLMMVVMKLREPNRDENMTKRMAMIQRVWPRPDPGEAWGTAERGA
jgi:hypothetical protein